MREITTRRRFVVGAGTAGAVLLAGCIETGGSDDGTTTEEGMMDDGTTTEEGMMDDGTTTDDDMMDDGTTTDDGMMEPTDPASAERVSVDRFSEEAGTLIVRTEENGLPGPDEPVDFDKAPFLTQGFGPDGEVVRYYNFDVQATSPAPIFVLFREGNSTPVEDQLNVIDVVPGEEGYNDFWHVHTVTVPEDYVANTVTSRRAIEEAGFEVEETDILVNCPVVPDGSTASMRHGDGDAGLVEGWYHGKVVSYFEFVEAPLSPTGGSVPLSPIYVTFNGNPGEEGGGPPSGFVTEEGSDQTHNVVATLPGDDGYSPLWLVNIYDNADFESVSDLESAMAAEQLASGAANVNCPIVFTDGMGS